MFEQRELLRTTAVLRLRIPGKIRHLKKGETVSTGSGILGERAVGTPQYISYSSFSPNDAGLSARNTLGPDAVLHSAATPAFSEQDIKMRRLVI